MTELPSSWPEVDAVHLAASAAPDGALSNWRPTRVVRVRDGDTLNVVVSLVPTLGIDARLACRLAGVNCPEKNTPEGQTAIGFTADWIKEHVSHAPTNSEWPFLTRVDGWDNYGGRYDGLVRCWAGHDLSSDLVVAGQAIARRYRAIVPEAT